VGDAWAACALVVNTELTVGTRAFARDLVAPDEQE
jgi:hypothetical protein